MFQKFFQQTKSAVILRYKIFFVLRFDQQSSRSTIDFLFLWLDQPSRNVRTFYRKIRKFCFPSSESSLLKYKKFLKLGICRKFHLLKYKKFFQIGCFYISSLESSLLIYKKFFKEVPFSKIKEKCFFEKI